jgi:hypothetical protein
VKRKLQEKAAGTDLQLQSFDLFTRNAKKKNRYVLPLSKPELEATTSGMKVTVLAQT